MAATQAELDRLLSKLERPVREAFLEAIRQAKSDARIAQMARALQNNDIDAAIRAAGINPGTYSRMVLQIQNAYVESGFFMVRRDLPVRYSLEFEFQNQRVQTYLFREGQRILDDLNRQAFESLRYMLERGLERGDNPLTTARNIAGWLNPKTRRRSGGVIGLTPEFARAYETAIRELEELNSNYKRRKRRDRRYDRWFDKAKREGKRLTSNQIRTMTERYYDRLLSLRAENIARTETMSALNAASQEALVQIVESGTAPPSAIKRVWKHSRQPNERPGHFKLDGTKVGLHETFINPDTGEALMYPGDGPASEVINCRCVVQHEIDFVEVENWINEQP